MILYWWMIVQVIAESLPISSSGHVMLLEQFFYEFYNFSYFENHELLAFDQVLQGISAFIFLCYFFCSWWQLVINKPVAITSLCDRTVWLCKIPDLFLFGCIADGITFLAWQFNIKNFIQIPLSCGFFITGCALFSIRSASEKKDINIWGRQSAVIVGILQACSLLPGVSRFAITVAGLQWLGYKSSQALSVSFLLQFPLILAASIRGFIMLQGTQTLNVLMQHDYLITIFCLIFIGYIAIDTMHILMKKNLLWRASFYMILPCIIAFYWNL